MWNHASFVWLVVYLTPWKIWVRQLGWWLIPTDQSCSSHQPVVFPYIISFRYCFIISIYIFHIIYGYHWYEYYTHCHIDAPFSGHSRTQDALLEHISGASTDAQGAALPLGSDQRGSSTWTTKHSHEAKQNRLMFMNVHEMNIMNHILCTLRNLTR